MNWKSQLPTTFLDLPTASLLARAEVPCSTRPGIYLTVRDGGTRANPQQLTSPPRKSPLPRNVLPPLSAASTTWSPESSPRSAAPPFPWERWDSDLANLDVSSTEHSLLDNKVPADRARATKHGQRKRHTKKDRKTHHPPERFDGSGARAAAAASGNDTKNNQGPTLPPKTALHSFARKLGIDPVHDANLLWICEAAFTVTLPDGWCAIPSLSRHSSSNENLLAHHECVSPYHSSGDVGHVVGCVARLHRD